MQLTRQRAEKNCREPTKWLFCQASRDPQVSRGDAVNKEVRNATPPSPVATDSQSAIDHQRTYFADPELHSQILASVGETIAPQRGPEYLVRRRLGPVNLDRTLITWYFDTEELDLYRSGAMLRCRGRQGSGGELPATGLIESRFPGGSGLQRTVGTEQPFQRSISNLEDSAVASVSDLIGGRPLHAVASQKKNRQLLFASFGTLGKYRPEIVIAVDDVQLESLRDTSRQSNRREVEIQIFTKLPWLKRVDKSRVERFEVFSAEAEKRFALVTADSSSYQAVSMEILS